MIIPELPAYAKILLGVMQSNANMNAISENGMWNWNDLENGKSTFSFILIMKCRGGNLFEFLDFSWLLAIKPDQDITSKSALLKANLH